MVRKYDSPGRPTEKEEASHRFLLAIPVSLWEKLDEAYRGGITEFIVQQIDRGLGSKKK